MCECARARVCVSACVCVCMRARACVGVCLCAREGGIEVCVRGCLSMLGYVFVLEKEYEHVSAYYAYTCGREYTFYVCVLEYM